MDGVEDKDTIADLADKIRNWEGTLEQAEVWLVRLKDLDPVSVGLWNLEGDLRVRHKFTQLVAEIGERLSKSQLVEIVQKLQSGEANGEDEPAALLILLERNVPHPAISDLIFWSPEKLSAEEIVEHALAYQPIHLEPPTENPPYYYGPPPRC